MLQNISDFKAALVLGDEFVFCACLDWVFLVCSSLDLSVGFSQLLRQKLTPGLTSPQPVALTWCKLLHQVRFTCHRPPQGLGEPETERLTLCIYGSIR